MISCFIENGFYIIKLILTATNKSYLYEIIYFIEKYG